MMKKGGTSVDLMFRTPVGDWPFSSMVVFGIDAQNATCLCRKVTKTFGRKNSTKIMLETSGKTRSCKDWAGGFW